MPDYVYDSDQGFTCIARMSAAEAAISGFAAGDADAQFHALVSGSRKRFGIHARGVSLSRSVGAAGDTATKSSFLAYPTTAALDAVNIGDEVTINSKVWKVSSIVPERAK